MYQIAYDDKWGYYFDQLDEETKERVVKKIKKILEFPEKRHLKHINFFVDEIGQNRITYAVYKEQNKVKFYFVGTHKEYEKWYDHFF